MTKKKKFEVELHYDDRCNYVLFRKGRNFAYYLEVTEEELTGMERSLGIDLTDDNKGIPDQVRDEEGKREYIDRTIESIGVFNSAFSKAFEGEDSSHPDENEDIDRAADNAFDEYKKGEKNEF